MALQVKQNLPDQYVNEYSIYDNLYRLGVARSVSGDLSYTSTSSGVAYNSTTGQLGILQQLETVLSSYLISSNDYNNISNEFASKTEFLSHEADIAIDAKNPLPPLVGAKGGMNDDTLALQNILNSMTNGGTLFLPEVFRISDRLYIPYMGIKVVGKGVDNRASGLIQTTAGKDVIYSDKEIISFEGIRCLGAGSGAGAGIHLYANNRCRIVDCYFDSYGTDGGIFLEGPVGGSSGNSWVVGNYVALGFGKGINMSRQHDNHIMHNKIERPALDGIYSYLGYSCTIMGNEVNVCGMNGFNFVNDRQHTIIGNWSDKQVLAGCVLSHCTDMSITGNQIRGNGQHGILLDYTHNVGISNNSCFDNGTSLANTYDGIYIWHSCKACIVVGNVCGSYATEVFQRFGINTYDVRNSVIKDNYVGGNLSGGVGQSTINVNTKINDLNTESFNTIKASAPTYVRAYDICDNGWKTTGITQTDVARTLKISIKNNNGVTTSGVDGGVSVTGYTALGQYITETIVFTAVELANMLTGAVVTKESVNPFLTVITVKGITQPAGFQYCIGIGNKIGLKGRLERNTDVLKMIKNSVVTALSSANVSLTYATVDLGTVVDNDSFTLSYLSSSNTFNQQ